MVIVPVLLESGVTCLEIFLGCSAKMLGPGSSDIGQPLNLKPYQSHKYEWSLALSILALNVSRATFSWIFFPAFVIAWGVVHARQLWHIGRWPSRLSAERLWLWRLIASAAVSQLRLRAQSSSLASQLCFASASCPGRIRYLLYKRLGWNC